MSEARTFQVRSEGGAVFDVDYPPSSAARREVLEDQVAKGQLVVIGVYVGDELADCDSLAASAPAEVSDEGGFPVPPSTELAADSEDAPVAPPLGASKAAWHDYALSVGVEPSKLVDLTKADIIEKYAPTSDED